MAPDSQDPAISALIARLDQARKEISSNGEALRHDLDVASHVRQSIKTHKPAWITGAAITGSLLALLPFRKSRTVKVKKTRSAEAKETQETVSNLKWTGILLMIGRMLLPIVKPVLMSYATKKFGGFASHREFSNRK